MAQANFYPIIVVVLKSCKNLPVINLYYVNILNKNSECLKMSVQVMLITSISPCQRFIKVL